MSDTVTVHVRGLDQLLRGLEIAPELLETESRDAMQKSVDLTKALVVSRIATGPGRNGHLRNLISARVIGPPIKGLVDADKHTAPWVEFGTTPHIIKEPSGLVIHHPGARARHPFRRGFGAAKKVIKAYFLSAATETLHKIVKGG